MSILIGIKILVVLLSVVALFLDMLRNRIKNQSRLLSIVNSILIGIKILVVLLSVVALFLDMLRNRIKNQSRLLSIVKTDYWIRRLDLTSN